MRCKRCGEILDPADTQCPVCGKSLTPARRRPGAPKPGENNIKLPQLDKFSHAYHRDSARSRKLQLVTIAAVAVVAVVLALVYISVGNLLTAVEQLQQDSQTLLQSQQKPDPAPVPTDPTDPTEQTAPPTEDAAPLPLNQQNVEASVTLRRSEGDTFAAAQMDLGDFEDRAAAWVSTAGKPADRQVSASWVLEKSGDQLDVKLCDSYSGAEGRFFASLAWSLTGDTFSGYANAMCIWEYRISGGEWESMPLESMTAVPGGCEVLLTPEALEQLLPADGQLEVRCHVSMTNTAGGAMNITAGGIVLDAEGLTE